MLRRRNYRLRSVGVSALRVTRIDGGHYVTVALTAHHGSVRVPCGRIQAGVDLRIRTARTGVCGAIDIVAGNIRGSARSPRQTDHVDRRWSARTDESCGGRRI